MKNPVTLVLRLVVLVLMCLSCWEFASAKWRYFRAGNATDSNVTPQPGLALMGGGSHLEEAFRYLCNHANRGDFLTLRANTEDTYVRQNNKEIIEICPLNSAATIIFSDREDSEDPKIVDIIDHAGVIFIAGGDQSNYIRFWQDTPVQEALNRHIAKQKPIGGSSAGLAVLGEFSFASIVDTIHSNEALADPYSPKVTISRDFLTIPLLAGTITDTHFVKRDRLGRLLVFMARILQDRWADRVRGIAVDENASVLVDSDGTANIVGGRAYFLEAQTAPETCKRKTPLRFSGIAIRRMPPGSSFNLSVWQSTSGDTYQLAVADGGVKSVESSNHEVY